MKTLEGIISDGQIRTSEPLDAWDNTRVVVTILDETLDELRVQAQATLDAEKQARLSKLLEINKTGQITAEQESELDDILARVHELAAKKARASRLLEQLKL
ncbi:MAG TPA: hypothetical protein EYP49_21290 [Anaerolineae bacterium]|nr:hypothetical protein [Anaerolineae bacterium]